MRLWRISCNNPETPAAASICSIRPTMLQRIVMMSVSRQHRSSQTLFESSASSQSSSEPSSQPNSQLAQCAAVSLWSNRASFFNQSFGSMPTSKTQLPDSPSLSGTSVGLELLSHPINKWLILFVTFYSQVVRYVPRWLQKGSRCSMLTQPSDRWPMILGVPSIFILEPCMNNLCL